MADTGGPPNGGIPLHWDVVDYTNGARYEGYLDAGNRRQQLGRLSDGNGAVYEGEFLDGQMHGYGRYTYDTEATRRHYGLYKDGEIHGDGVFEDPDFRYVGTYESGRKQGKGITAPLGDSPHNLRHTWEKGHPQDTTQPTLPELLKEYVVKRHRIRAAVELRVPPAGNCSAEEWGRGREAKELTLPSGCTYSGACHGARRHGFGVWNHPTGDRYEGQWVDNKKSGWGAYSSSSRRYEGEWAADKMNGWGVYRLNERDVFVGTHIDDTKNGTAVVFPEGGAPTEQIWDQGTLVKEGPAPQDLASDYSTVRKIIEAAVRGVLKSGAQT